MANDLRAYVNQYAREYGVPANIAQATFGVESSFGTDPTMRTYNEAGAIGPMQVTQWDEKLQRYFPNERLEATDDVANIRVGMKELADAYKLAGGDPTLTYVAYNAGPQGMKDIVSGKKPMPEETEKALVNYNKYLNQQAQPTQQAQPLTQNTFGNTDQLSIEQNLSLVAQGQTLDKMVQLAQQRVEVNRQKENDPIMKEDRKLQEAEIIKQKQMYDYAIVQSKTGLDKFEHSLKPYNPPKADPYHGFTSIGMTFALIASAFSKQPAMNSLHAMQGFMSATKERDKEAMERYTTEWENSMKLAKARFDAEDKSLKDILSYSAKQPELARALMQVHASQYDDKEAAIALEEQNWGQIGKLQMNRAELFDKMQQHGEMARNKALIATKLVNDQEEAKNKEAAITARADEVSKSRFGMSLGDLFIKNQAQARALLGEAGRDFATKPTEKGIAARDEATANYELAKQDAMKNPDSMFNKLGFDINSATKEQVGVISKLWEKTHPTIKSVSAAKGKAIQDRVDSGESYEEAVKSVAKNTDPGPKPGSVMATREAYIKKLMDAGMSKEDATIRASLLVKPQSSSLTKWVQLQDGYKQGVTRINRLLKNINENSAATGKAGGIFGLKLEAIGNLVGINETVRADIKADIEFLKANMIKLASMETGTDSAAAIKLAETILPSTTWGTTVANALSRLKMVRDQFEASEAVVHRMLIGDFDQFDAPDDQSASISTLPKQNTPAAPNAGLPSFLDALPFAGVR